MTRRIQWFGEVQTYQSWREHKSFVNVFYMMMTLHFHINDSLGHIVETRLKRIAYVVHVY